MIHISPFLLQQWIHTIWYNAHNMIHVLYSYKPVGGDGLDHFVHQKISVKCSQWSMATILDYLIRDSGILNLLRWLLDLLIKSASKLWILKHYSEKEKQVKYLLKKPPQPVYPWNYNWTKQTALPIASILAAPCISASGPGPKLIAGGQIMECCSW